MSLKKHTESLRESYGSKKFWSFMFSVFVMFAFALFATRCGALVPMFDAFVGGVVAALGIYQTGNIMNKHVVSKNLASTVEKEEPEEAAPKLD